ncbi:MAG: hypothetical protein HC895_00155 [Leptolyngbyaceae cyanobacterium SM1_3_5]|nr:hypothetical protein [Leptolyngbyaceae cyanobacterium SM1_3_5]
MTYTLQPGTGYTLGTSASSTVTFRDTPAPAAAQVVGISAVPAALIEEQGTAAKLTFTLSQAPPAEGLVVTLDSETARSLAQFDVFAARFDGARLIRANADASGLTLRLTKQVATIDLPVFNDDLPDSPLTLTYALQPGDGYAIDPSASGITLTITDSESTPTPTPTPTPAPTPEPTPTPTPTPEPTPTPAPVETPIVSLTATPETISEAEGTPVTFSFKTTGTFPAEGIVIGTSEFFDPQFDFNFEFEDPSLLSGIEFFDYVESESGEVTVFWKLTSPDAFIKVKAFDDTIAEADVTSTLILKPGTGYTVNPAASSVTTTITDGVPNVGGPSVSFSVDKTELVEGDKLTITLTADGEIPAGGLSVNVDSDAAVALGEFAVFDAEGNFLLDIDGLAGFPAANEDGSGFSVVMTENTATLSIDVFNDDDTEGAETLTFNLLDGEAYNANPAADQVTLTITDPVAPPTGPIVSLETIAGTFDRNDNLLAQGLVRSLEAGSSVLTFALNVEGEIPEGGLVVTVKSDIALIDFFANLGNPPFSPGGRVLEGVYDATGKGIGFKFRIDQPNALITFPLRNVTDASGDPIVANFTLEVGEGYSIDSQDAASAVPFYNTIDQVPAATVTPTISFSTSSTALSEAAGDTTTFTFSLSEAPPSEGVLVYVKSTSGGRDLAEFDIFNAEVSGGAFPAPNFRADGFFFKVTEQTATIALKAFNDGEQEGIENFGFAIQAAPGYSIAPDAGSVSIGIVDDAGSQIQVGLTTEPAILVESAQTVSIHRFSLSTEPPEGGLVVSVVAPNIGEFDLSGIAIENGEIVRVTPTGFDFKITAKTATINLPVANDGTAEGLETATFTLQDAPTYQISPTANTGTFSIVDAPDQIPVSTIVREPNDIISRAVDTRLSATNDVYSVRSSIDYEGTNTYRNPDGSLTRVDATEDVDFYKVTLKAAKLSPLTRMPQQWTWATSSTRASIRCCACSMPMVSS